MGTAEHSIRFIGRSDILQQVIERLLRPDDLRNNPDQFIRPGFYGLAGTGKSRLLQEIAARAGSITPYVLKLDFETRSGQTLPGTPLNLLRYLIDHLEELDRLSRPVWSRLFWRWSNPFNQCKRLLADWVPPSVSQVIQITSSSASQIAQNISLGTTIPDSLENAFQSALCKLHSRVQTRVVFGDFGQARKFPLILILLDTVDVAPKSIREWLPEMPRLASGKNRLAFHLLVVGAGRARVDGIAETALPPLPEADARLFVREYLSYKLARAAENRRPGSLQALSRSEAAQNRTALLAQGVPLLIQLLVDAAGLDESVEAESHELPNEHHARISFVIDNYLTRLRKQAVREHDGALWRRYYLLLYSTIPRRIPNSGLLRAMLVNLEGTPFDQRTNYDEIFEELLYEAYFESAADHSVVVHSLIREGVLSYLEENDPERLRLVHERAAAWFKQHGVRTDYIYHALRFDFPRAFPELRIEMQGALERNQLSEAGRLLATSIDLRLGPVEKGWLTILNADLAWAEHDPQLALDRLRTLYSSQQIAELDNEIASRLEKWLGFGTGSDDLQLQLHAAPFPGYFSDLLWWAAERKVPVMEAFAARMLAQEAIGQKNFDRAITLLKRSLNISRELGDHASSGTISEMLAELTLRTGPFSEAAEYAAGAAEHYASASKPADEARMKTVLAIALFYSPRQNECEALIENALAGQRELQDIAGQARSLRVLGHLVFLVSGSGGAKRAEECLSEASSLYQRAGDVLGRAHSLLLLADIAYSLRRYSGLGEFCVSASQLFQITEDRLGEAHLHFILGTLAALRQYYASPAMLPELFRLRAHPDSIRVAIAHLRRARDLYLKGDDPLSWAHTLTLLAAFQYASWKQDDLGGDSDVQNMLRNALTVYEEQKDLLGMAGIDLILGQIAHGELDLERAGRHFTNALHGFEALPLPEAGFLKSAAAELLTRVEQGLGPLDKHVAHIIAVWRCRSLRMQGWSAADRAETIDMITIFDLPSTEVAADAVERVRRSALPWPT